MDYQMGEAEIKLKNCILERFRSIRGFALALGVPCSSVNNVLRRGVVSVNVSTAATLCSALGLDVAAFVSGEITPATGGGDEPWALELLEDCRNIDTHGRELVGMVAKKERERCREQVVSFPAARGETGWQRYVGAPIACRGGGVTEATEEDAKQMDRIYRRLLADRGDKKG